MNIKFCNKLIAFLILLLIACEPAKITQSCDFLPNKLYIPPFQKQFQFNKGSYWVFQSSTNPNIDTMSAGSLSFSWLGFPPSQNTTSTCISFQTCFVALSHMSFVGGDDASYWLSYENIISDAIFIQTQVKCMH